MIVDKPKLFKRTKKLLEPDGQQGFCKIQKVTPNITVTKRKHENFFRFMGFFEIFFAVPEIENTILMDEKQF